MTSYIFLKIVALLVLPPASLAVGAVLCLLLTLVGWRRLARIALGLAIAQNLVLSFPPVTNALVGILETRAHRIETESPTCCYDAIVALGGAVAPAAPPAIMEPDLTEAADRVWQAARFYHAGVAPRIIVSGGSFNNQQGGPATTEAEAMRRFLLDLGVPDGAIVSEGQSLNTIENIRNVRAIVKDGRVLIITSAFHVPRVAELSKRAKLDAAFYATDWWQPEELRVYWENWIPDIGSMAWSGRALRELVALAFDFRGASLEQ